MAEASKLKAYAYILITVVIWGFSFISIKASLEAFPPMVLALARFVIALGILAIIKRIRAPKERLARKDIPMMALAGIFGDTLYFFFENNGVLLNTPSECSIIIATIPVLTMIADRLMYKTKLGARQFSGASLSLVGVGLIVSETLRISGQGLGYLFMLGAAISWIVYTFMTKGLFDRYSRLSVVYYQSLFGCAGFLPFALLELPRIGPIEPSHLFHLGFLAVLCTALCYYLFAVSLGRLGPSKTNLFVNLIPVVTVGAESLLGKAMAPTQLAGGAIVVIGIYLATLPAKGGRIAKSP